jgi:hypothetical protein
MLFRFTKLFLAVGLAVAMWGLIAIRQSDPRVWVHPAGSRPGPVRILQFYANVGTLTLGEKALLCYGVENAKTVRISPIVQGVYPAHSHCLEIVPEHTTHYTILAEGYDGGVVTRSFTLMVHAAPAATPPNQNYAKYLTPDRTPSLAPPLPLSPNRA